MLKSKFRLSGKSFIDIINNKGPNIELSRIPLRNEAHFEKTPFNLTRSDGSVEMLVSYVFYLM